MSYPLIQVLAPFLFPSNLGLRKEGRTIITLGLWTSFLLLHDSWDSEFGSRLRP